MEACYPTKTSYHVGEVATEHTTISVQFVDDDVVEVLEELKPSRMVWQDSRVEHVWVREDDAAVVADRTPCIGGGVSVEDMGADVDPGRFNEPMKACVLILSEGFGGEEVERPRLAVLKQSLQDWDVVAEGLPRRGGSGDRDVLPTAKSVDRLRLMHIGSLDTALAESVEERGVQVGRKVARQGRARRTDEVPCDVRSKTAACRERIDDVIQLTSFDEIERHMASPS